MKYLFFIISIILISFNSLAIRDGGGPCNEFRAIAECDPASVPNSIRIDILAPAGISYTVGGTTYSGNTFNVGLTGPFLIDINNNPLARVTSITGSGTMTITNFRCYSGGAYTGLLCTDNASLGKTFGSATQPNISGGTGTYAPGASVSLTASCLTGTLNWYTGSCGGTNVGTGSPFTSTAMSTTTYYARCEDACITTTCDTQTINRSAGGSPSVGNFSWIESAWSKDCSGDIYPTDIAVDNSNNIYSAGVFGTGSGFGKIYRFSATDSLGAEISETDNYIAKYDATGNLLWKASIASKQEEGTARIDCDNSGNLFFTAQMSKGTGGTGIIKLGQSNGTYISTVQNNSYGDGVLVKYNSAGMLQWHRHFYKGGIDSISFEIEDVKTDASGDVYICGAFRGQVTIGGAFTDAVGPGPLFSTDKRSVFIAKFNGSTGALSWLKKGSAGENNRAMSLYIDGASVYAYGFYEENTTTSDPEMIIEGTTLSTPPSDSKGHFLIKYNSAGVFDWVDWGYILGGTTADVDYKYIGGNRPAINGDAFGNVYLLQNPRSIGSGFTYRNRLGSVIYAVPGAASGVNSYMMMKYSSSGTLTWGKGESNPNAGYLHSIRGFTPSASGGFNAAMVFRTNITLGSTTYTNAGDRDMVLVEFDTSGTVTSVTQYGDANDDYSAGIELMPNNQLAYTGYLSNPGGATLPLLHDPYDGIFIGICDQKTAITGVWGCAPPSQPGTITGNTNICSSSQTYSVAAVALSTSYTWTYTGGGTPVSTTNSVTFTPTSSGTLSVTANNSCGPSTPRTLAITVISGTPSQPSAISGTTPVCSGSSQTYSVTNVAGVTYAWSYSGGGTASSTTNSVTFTPTSSGTLSVTASNVCGTSTPRTLAITVDAATPSQPSTITGTTPVCSGSSQTYNVTNVAGVTYAWSYSGGGTASSTTNSVTFTPTSSGTLSVTASNSCGTSAARTLAITVDAATPAQPSTISGTTPVCSGSSQTYSVTNVAGVTYAWSYSGGGTATSTTNSVTFTPTSSGTLSVTASNSCGTSAARTLAITVDAATPATPSAITGNTNICSSSQTYSVTNVAGVTYAWSYSGGGTATSTTNSVTFTPTSSGTLSVTASNSCGTSAASTLGITVSGSSAPAQPSVITGTTPVCSGSSQTYSVTNVAGVTYAWSYSGGGSPSSTTNSVTFTPSSSGTLSVTASNACGASTPRTLAITVDAATPATPSAITGTTPVCSSSQTYSVTNVAGVTYAWSYSGGGTATSTTNSVTFTPTSSGTLSVTASNSCGTSAASTLAITVDAATPSTPSAITGTTPVCSSSQTYSVTNVAGVTYAWSYSGGGTATSTTNSVTFTPTSSGTLSVTASNSCGTSAASTLAITVDAAAPSTPSAITGTTPVCSSSQTYSVTNVAGVTYAWSYSGGGTATSTTNSVTFTPTSSGTLSVTASNSCGTSAASTLAITVDAAAPSTPSAITGTTPVCSSSQTYSVTNVAGVTYAWSYSGGGTATSTTNSVTFTPTSSGTLSVTASNSCGTSAASTLAITVLSGAPSQPSSIIGSTNVCSTSETYSVTNVAGVTYAWSYTGTGSPSSTTNSVTFTPTSSGTLSVTATNACGTSSPQTLVINVASGTPAQPSAISGPASICSVSPQTYSVTNVAGVTYAWTYSGGGTPTGTINSTTFTPTSSGTLSVTASNACGTSSPQTLNIVIGTSVPATPGAISGLTTLCSSSQTYGVVPVTGASSYTWSYTGGGAPISTTNTVTFTPTSSGTLSVTASNPCGTSAASTLNITVDNGVPATPSAITGNTIICDNSLQTYSVTNVAGVTYTWSYSGVGSPSSTTNSVSFNPTSSGTLSVIATNSCGSSAQSTLNIVVDILAPVNLGADQAVCTGSTVNLSIPNNVSYSYLWSDGATTNTFTANPTSAQTIWVRVTNSSGCIVTDTLEITITGPTTITANDDSVTVVTDRLEVLDVTTNDSQLGNINIVNSPQFGVASINSNGDLTYKSYIDFTGYDVLTYEICDAFCSLTCDTATVYIKVEHNVFDNTDNGNIGSWGVTPDGDGINDVLLIDGLYEYPDNEITIFNRWGDKIYHAKPYNQDWNGLSPKEVVNGTYFFILEIEGKSEAYKGFIHLQK